MNLSDGSVEIRAEGESIVVQHLIDAVRRGPRGSRVDDVEIESVEITDGEMSEFNVRY
jgi:acylphosphatase